jgi:DNA-binding beta-propeller fold protein YncE
MKQLLFFLLFAFFYLNVQSQSKKTPVGKKIDSSKILEDNIFPTDAKWFNTDVSITLEKLRGKIVLIHFFNTSNMDCLKSITELERLKNNFKNEIEIICVNSPIFNADKSNDFLLHSILKNNIEYPTINDSELIITTRFSIKEFPTTLVISEKGELLKQFNIAKSNQQINLLIKEKISENTTTASGSEFYYKKEKTTEKNSILRYPSKIEADHDNNYLFVSDAGNNRILIMDEYGAIISCIGSGIEGDMDGDYSLCSFNNPQGMAFDKATNILYIADTDNNSIRKVDLNLKTVLTIIEKNASIDLPYELICKDNFLFISNRGSGSLVKVNLNKEESNELKIETLLSKQKMLTKNDDIAGISLDSLGDFYYTDANNSKVKKVDLQTKKYTLFGSPDSSFGDADGKNNVALFQYPLGISCLQNDVFIVDSYNNKIKQIGKNKISTFLGSNLAGNKNGSSNEASFYHPSDITLLNGKYFITDTYNHLIRVYNPESGMVKSLVINDYQNLNRNMMQKNVALYMLDTLYISSPQQKINIKLLLDSKYEFNKVADSEIYLTQSNDEVYLENQDFINGNFYLNTNLQSNTSEAQINCILYYNQNQRMDLAYFKEIVLLVPLVVQENTISTNEIIFNVPE